MSKYAATVQKRSLLLYFLILLMTASCGIREVVTREAAPLPITISETIENMHAREARFNFFETRFSGQAVMDNNSYGISGNLRIKKDSAIFISVTPMLGIEMARMLITPDTVRLLNRLEGTYFEGDVGFVNSLLNTDLDFYMLQAILVGNDFSHFTTDNFHLKEDQGRLLLQHYDRNVSRSGALGSTYQQNIWIDRDSFRIRENLLFDPASHKSMRASYSRFEHIGGQAFPGEVSILITEPGTRSELKVRYSRTAIDQPRPISFSIPPRYTPMQE